MVKLFLTKEQALRLQFILWAELDALPEFIEDGIHSPRDQDTTEEIYINLNKALERDEDKKI